MRKYQYWIFFFTGVSALIYEICWVRQATLIFGVSVFAYSTVLTAYMGGMAIGNFVFGKWADKTTNLFRLFTLLHIILAATGILTLYIFGGLRSTYASLVLLLPANKLVIPVIRLILAWIAMTPPAICIGGMMPVMTRLASERDGWVGHDAGLVYVVNTLGSVFGCGVTAIFLIRWFGLHETVFLSAGLNLILALLIYKTKTPKISPKKPKQESNLGKPHSNKQTSSVVFSFILFSYAISGFTALGYEIVWARIISLHTIGAIYSFSIMLAVFLTGLTLGGLVGTRWVRRQEVDTTHFGLLEMGIGLFSLLVLPVFSTINKLSIESIFGGYSVFSQVLFEGLLSFITLFPVTVLIGVVFPVVCSLYTTEKAFQVGNQIGKVISLNTVGSILGALVTGFLLVPSFGLQRSTFILAILNILIGVSAILFFSISENRIRYLSLGVMLAVILLGLFMPQKRYLGYWESVQDYLLFYEEGVETTVAVFDAGPSNPKFSTVNGRVEVPTDPLSMRAFYLLGHLPALLRPGAQNALMLSFGNGIATGALSSHEIPSIDVVELSSEMIEAADVYSVENRNVSDYPGLNIHVEDARNYLLQTEKKFDIITTDATHPANSSSWTLFTFEFYRDIKNHLEEDGVFLQWVPIHSISIIDYLSIIKTFQNVFPTATLWYTGGSHTLLLATSETLTPELLNTKLESLDKNPLTKQDLGNADKITRHWIMNSDQLREFSDFGEIVYDNDAFFMPNNSEMEELIQIIQLAAIRANQ